ncbi:hypothetical protein D3C81_1095170 [compost metagenome]
MKKSYHSTRLPEQTPTIAVVRSLRVNGRAVLFSAFMEVPLLFLFYRLGYSFAQRRLGRRPDGGLSDMPAGHGPLSHSLESRFCSK